MHRIVGSVLVGGLLVVTSVGGAVAQDEDRRIGESAVHDQSVEVPEAGIAISFPPGWDVEVEMNMGHYELPPVYGEGATTPVTRVLTAELHGQDGLCRAYRYLDNPMALDEHAAWAAESVAASQGAEVEVEAVMLPAGDAIKLIQTIDVGVAVTYLLDGGGVRFELGCASGTPMEDDWRLVADTIELIDIDSEPVDEPVGRWESGPFDSVISVSETEVMRASCERAVWVEHADGTYEERISCVLTDEPVGPSDTQGSAPNRMVLLDGGECEWVSDFWLAEDGSQVWAESWTVTIGSDGSVLGRSWYGAEELDCS